MGFGLKIAQIVSNRNTIKGYYMKAHCKQIAMCVWVIIIMCAWFGDNTHYDRPYATHFWMYPMISDE